MIIIKNNKYHNGTLVFVRAKVLAKARSNKVVGGRKNEWVRIFSQTLSLQQIIVDIYPFRRMERKIVFNKRISSNRTKRATHFIDGIFALSWQLHVYDMICLSFFKFRLIVIIKRNKLAFEETFSIVASKCHHGSIFLLYTSYYYKETAAFDKNISREKNIDIVSTHLNGWRAVKITSSIVRRRAEHP